MAGDFYGNMRIYAQNMATTGKHKTPERAKGQRAARGTRGWGTSSPPLSYMRNVYLRNGLWLKSGCGLDLKQDAKLEDGNRAEPTLYLHLTPDQLAVFACHGEEGKTRRSKDSTPNRESHRSPSLALSC